MWTTIPLSGTPQGAGGVGGLVSALDTNGTPGTTADDKQYFYYCDAMGNVGQVIDATIGPLAAQYDYTDPFGGCSAGGAWSTKNPFRFSTKYFDGEIDYADTANDGLYYYGYRYYSPRLGRWLSRDPIGEAGGYNLLSMIRNRPTNSIDSLGLFQLSAIPGVPDISPPSDEVLSRCSDASNRPPLASTDSHACQYAANARYSANFWVDTKCKAKYIEVRTNFGVTSRPWWWGECYMKNCLLRVAWPIKCVCLGMGNSPFEKCLRGCLQCAYDATSRTPDEATHLWCSTRCLLEQASGTVTAARSLANVIQNCANTQGCVVGNHEAIDAGPESRSCEPPSSKRTCASCTKGDPRW